MIKSDGIIFDMDGTIWDNTGIFAKSWTRAAKDHGYDVLFTPEKLKGLFGRTMTEIADASIPDPDSEKRYATLEDCEKYEMNDLMESSEDTTYEGLKEVLESLSKRTKLYIISNCQSGYIEAYLKISGHAKYFTDFICYGDNGLGKAENIKLIVKKHDIKNPVYVGDIEKDHIASDAAGVGFIWASYGYGDRVSSCLAKLDSIYDLDKVIE